MGTPDTAAVAVVPGRRVVHAAVTCGLCGGGVRVFLDFGEVVLAGAFVKRPERQEKYPLRLGKCSQCHAVQVADKVDPELMFREYRYFSSATQTMREHFRTYAQQLVDRFKPQSVLEIGCNDGVMLYPLMGLGVRVAGVDPSSAAAGVPNVRQAFFTEALARTLEPVDVVLASNVFAHMPDINDAVRGVRAVMKDGGVFVFEVNHLGRMLKGLQYDWVYHEHAYYHSLLSLAILFSKYGMTVFDVEVLPTHAGSVRFYVCKDTRPVSKRVTWLLAEELDQGLHRNSTFERFAEDVHAHRDAMRSVLGRLKAKGKKIAGYGACGRAAAMIQWCDIGGHLEYMVDDSPEKQGYLMPASHLPIYGRQALTDRPVDYVLVFAWSFLSEIRSKHNLPMIVPLPYVRVLNEAPAGWKSMDGIGEWRAA